VNTTRRRVLAALAAAGGAGALSAAGSNGFIGDRERRGVGLTAGTLDVDLAYWQLPETGPGGPAVGAVPDGTANGPTLPLPVGPITEQDADGRVLVRIALPQSGQAPNNPARLWLRADCPPPTQLAEDLTVTLSYAAPDGTAGEPIVGGSLRDVATALRAGLALDGTGDTTDSEACLTDELYVVVAYDAGGYVGTETAALPLEIAAVQCRGTDPGNPFPAGDVGPCEGVPECVCCQAIGKLDVWASLQAGGTYTFTEGLSNFGIRVTETDGDAGVAFELVSTDGSAVPPLCEVQVKGGPGDRRYSRSPSAHGTSTDTLGGTDGGIVFAPENPNSGGRYDISYVLVKVCVPRESNGDCPADLVSPAASVGRPGQGRGGRQ
jgi:hypothetical protein